MSYFAMSPEDDPEQQASVIEVEQADGTIDIPEVLPILPLKNTVVYPIPILLPLIVGQPRSVKLVDEAVLGKRTIGLVALKDASIEEPGPDDMYWVGSAATIARFPSCRSPRSWPSRSRPAASSGT